MLHKTALTLVLLLIFTLVSAEVPQTINYQGYLTDSGGNPVPDNNYLMKFKIYGSEAGNDSLWWSGFQTIAVTNGSFIYHLGSLIPLPDDLFTDTVRYLGITVGVDPEITPRTRLTSVAYSYQSLRSDSAGYAFDIANNSVTGSKILNHSITFDDIGYDEIRGENIEDGTIDFSDIGPNGAADGQVMKMSGGTWVPAADNTGPGGDITGIIPGSGLSGGGTSGDVTLSVATNGILSSHIATGEVNSNDIQDYTIMNYDINNSAAISPSKISGTAVTVIGNETISGDKLFTGNVDISDNTVEMSANGLFVGEGSQPYLSRPINLKRAHSTTGSKYGMYSDVTNSSSGNLTGIYSTAISSGSGITYALHGYCKSDDMRVGVVGTADVYSTGGGTTDYSRGVEGVGNNGAQAFGGYFGAISGSLFNYGVYAEAAGDALQNIGLYGNSNVSGPANFGVFGTCEVSNGSWGGYFYGNLHATGTNTKGGGGFLIDHPDDPENMYLSHSDASSPDRMNIYNGNVITDENGNAVVNLPSYFDALNTDFRYQLTCIGTFAQAIIAEKIEGNRFAIKTDKPLVEVSLMVTGIRKDAFAKSVPLEVETLKVGDARGKFMNPEIFGFGVDKSVDFKNHRNVERTKFTEESE
ncbi:MAG: hypothetical protein CVT49_11210 [candidate division Zixibacteria bacterium HGW-Zixibacteria-1]|nr:MAG: hypothetical protein CVT49_11210 [candidate division Zixibacteria bacterium HGW-Zixibacteria-1]